MSGVQLPFVSALLVLDSEGQRVAVKYFDPTILGGAVAAAAAAAASAAATGGAAATPAASSATSAAKAQEQQLKAEVAFEKRVFAKTVRNQRQEGYDTIPEVMLLDNVVLVYKVLSDLVFYVAGGVGENELILQAVLQALDETMANLLKNQVSKKTVVENLDLLLLSIDEIVDEGLVLETDSSVVVGRVCMVGGGADGAGGMGKDVPLSEQTFTQALATAREQLVRSFR